MGWAERCGRLRLGLLIAVALASPSCARQVCQCAVYVGGATPANDAEEAARGRAVRECLQQHGGGTIVGCPMPASMPR